MNRNRIDSGNQWWYPALVLSTSLSRSLSLFLHFTQPSLLYLSVFASLGLSTHTHTHTCSFPLQLSCRILVTPIGEHVIWPCRLFGGHSRPTTKHSCWQYLSVCGFASSHCCFHSTNHVMWCCSIKGISYSVIPLQRWSLWPLCLHLKVLFKVNCLT